MHISLIVFNKTFCSIFVMGKWHIFPTVLIWKSENFPQVRNSRILYMHAAEKLYIYMHSLNRFAPCTCMQENHSFSAVEIFNHYNIKI